MSEKTYVIGRVVLAEGRQQIVPVNTEHRQEVLAYQRKVKRLLEAARAWRARQGEFELAELMAAAKAIE